MIVALLIPVLLIIGVACRMVRRLHIFVSKIELLVIGHPGRSVFVHSSDPHDIPGQAVSGIDRILAAATPQQGDRGSPLSRVDF